MAVKKGDSLSKVVERITSAVLKKEGSMSIDGSIDDDKSSAQTVRLEVL